jgi:hypothetical protein
MYNMMFVFKFSATNIGYIASKNRGLSGVFYECAVCVDEQQYLFDERELAGVISD